MSYVKEVFGKKYKDLTKQEKKLYHKQILGLGIREKSICRQKYGKSLKELTRTEKTACYYVKKDKYKNSKTFKLLNKRFKDLTEVEKRLLVKNSEWYQRKLKNSYKDGFCYNYFGKRYNELTLEEKREFNRIRKRESRKRTGRN